MRTVLLLLSLLLSLPALTQDLRIEEDVLPELRRLLDLANAASNAELGEKTLRYHDSIRYTLIDKTVSGGYLKDQNGKVWNMGVLGMPYVLHAVHKRSISGFESLSRIAEEFADEVMVFVMVAKPEDEGDDDWLQGLSDRLVIVYEENVRSLNTFPTDTRLLGLIGYPVTYYVRTDRTVALAQWGGMTNQGRAYKERRNNVRDLLRGRLQMNWR
ncbi:hypothetical protein FUA23_19145 [Neolewinella aurantiaca]|uniref:Uncharacterized protein n=1 Tax=Neolewinella aurantiaca TaxID=2602767 RepID=A0A5C7FB94_9BACT|nr:hypothetical protein [Neolewinella aurantiaca]TXF86698.1 hypothetical protein FUA23_19145 [Neolewinella aurantiaca]